MVGPGLLLATKLRMGMQCAEADTKINIITSVKNQDKQMDNNQSFTSTLNTQMVRGNLRLKKM